MAAVEVVGVKEGGLKALYDVTCPNPKCEEVYHIDSRHTGRIFRCKKCGKEFPLQPPSISGQKVSRPVQEEENNNSRNVNKKTAYTVKRPYLWFAGIVIFIIIFSFLGSGIFTNKEQDFFYLQNGTQIIKPDYSSGYGYITIKNGTSRDAVVKLAEKPHRRKVRFVYIRKENRVTLRQIAPGEYYLLFSLGLDWDKENNSFKKDISCFAFDDSFEFIETAEGYYNYEVTLHQVIGGTAKTNKISEEEFNSIVQFDVFDI